MTDPKHLPPRDCLVLVTAPGGLPWWRHVEYDSTSITPGAWFYRSEFVGRDEVDPSRVITWTELPEAP